MEFKTYLSQIYSSLGSLTGQIRVPQIYIKLSADDQLERIEEIATNYTSYGIEGMIISSEKTPKDKIYQVLRNTYQKCGGEIPIISVGQISSAQDVIERVKNGASAVQILSKFMLNVNLILIIFKGPSMPSVLL